MSADVLEAVREVIQEDVAGRGLRADPAENLVTATAGDFAAACGSLAEAAEASVAVVTGFFIPHGQPPTGETDGPLGALFLARALVPLGVRVVLAADEFCVPALQAGLAASGLRKTVALVPLPEVQKTGTLSSEEYWQSFSERAGPVTHLVALERVGPSHTPESLAAQGAPPELVERFLWEVPPEHHDRCQTMRGRDVTPNTSPAHLLFETAARRPDGPISIGIGDGGNEVGMGKLPWDLVRRNIPGGGKVACRVATDHLIVCGVSNWGAYGLAACVRRLRGVAADPSLYEAERERRLLETMVERGPLVDGVTGLQTATVDGLDFDRHTAILQRVGALTGELG